MRAWWFSSNRMTVFVEVSEDGVVVQTAPVTRKFVGQPVANLERWMRKQGGFRKKEIAGR